MLNGRQQFGLALSAALAGLAWGYLRHRGDRRAMWFGVIQATEWFIAYGGAAQVLQTMREALDGTRGPDPDDFEIERVTRTRQIVSERTGTDG